MDAQNKLDLQEGKSETFFSNDGNTHPFVIAEPHETLSGAWVESKYSNGLRFETKELCQRYIDLNKTIPSLFKTTLRPKHTINIQK